MSSPGPRFPSSDWSGDILVALEQGEDRSVTRVVAADVRGFEVVTPLGLRPGDSLSVPVRCGGARRLRLLIAVRIESRMTAEGGHRVRLTFQSPDHEDVAALLTAARDRGVLSGETRPPPLPAADALFVRPGEVLPTLLLDLHERAVAAVALGSLLDAALMVPTDTPPPMNSRVLLRLLLPDGRPLWLAGRVVFHGETSPGHRGAGIALEPLPEAVRQAVRELHRGALAASPRAG